ncbi:MAG: hypothetical protein ACFE9M_13475, partial [Promethearchaeota archaeon]
EHIPNWKDEIKKVLGDFSSILVGNKLDLINNENRIIKKQESEILKKNLGSCAFFEASAKIGTGVEKFFLKLVSHIYKRY